MVDNMEGQNRGLYRVGKALDVAGQVTGGWGPWVEVPDWFSWSNQGAGIAVADLDGNGQSDLLVLMVDNPEGQNRECSASAAASTRTATSPEAGHPGSPCLAGSHGRIREQHSRLTPPDSAGMRDLIVFMIDAATEINEGLYKVGRRLDSNGNITGGWTDWIKVPDSVLLGKPGCGCRGR